MIRNVSGITYNNVPRHRHTSYAILDAVYMSKPFYITTPIFYPNAKPHLGHAYVVVLADVIARYHRLRGDDVYFLAGTDENSEKIKHAAEAAGRGVEEFTDGVVQTFRKFFGELDVSYSQFIRTSDKEAHWPGPLLLWKRLLDAGDIYKGVYEGLYCIGCEAFKTEKDLDEQGNCPDHGMPPKKLKEENYFFRLSKYRDALREKIISGEFCIVPDTRRREMLAFLEGGLQDISFSRPRAVVPWGIPVPGDPEHVMYVWTDALANYISALGFGRKDDANFKKFWPADWHVVGKDIVRFHTVIWPAMLLSAHIPIPKGVFVHGLIMSGGKKMSKTLGNIVDPGILMNEYGAEALRYYLAREVSPVEDSDMTIESFKKAYNAHLAHGLGNLVSRVMKMVETYEISLDELVLEDERTLVNGEGAAEYRDAFEQFRIDRAADVVWGEIAFMDSYIQETEPFKTIKEDEEKARADILFLVERLWEVAVLLEPFMPETSERIKEAIDIARMPSPLFLRKE